MPCQKRVQGEKVNFHFLERFYAKMQKKNLYTLIWAKHALPLLRKKNGFF
jgi:hypothetical protein